MTTIKNLTATWVRQNEVYDIFRIDGFTDGNSEMPEPIYIEKPRSGEYTEEDVLNEFI